MLSTLPLIPTLALAQWSVALLVVGFLFVCVLLILIILIQKPQGGGLSGAFGAGAAAGSGQTVFGARTGDALTVGTISVFVLYLLVAIGLNYAIRPPSNLPTAPAAQSAPSPDEVPAQVPAPSTGTNIDDISEPPATPSQAPIQQPAQPERQP